ncbi:tyrosine phosphatase family-domain-containing protein [Lipomyces japonicus]|uniref:tyrosine phosphatase family-domain-containing protein n=1 Tax=Lipomyces japonicus TaxID=56871 RepID=UPI0034CDBAD0
MSEIFTSNRNPLDFELAQTKKHISHRVPSQDTIEQKSNQKDIRTVKCENEDSLLLVTPLRYGIVQPKLYRGLYPRKVNLPFLRRLKLKTILSLTPEPLVEDIQEFCRREGINMIHIKISKGGKKGVSLTYKEVKQALEILISESRAPLYFHCINGSQATSLVIACLRKLSFWRTSSIFSEFMYYSDVSALDHKFVQDFRGEIQLPADAVPWIFKGLSRQGIVANHPTVKFKEAGTTTTATTTELEYKDDENTFKDQDATETTA